MLSDFRSSLLPSLFSFNPRVETLMKRVGIRCRRRLFFLGARGSRLAIWTAMRVSRRAENLGSTQYPSTCYRWIAQYVVLACRKQVPKFGSASGQRTRWESRPVPEHAITEACPCGSLISRDRRCNPRGIFIFIFSDTEGANETIRMRKKSLRYTSR